MAKGNLQTVIIKKNLAPSRSAAKRIASQMGYRTYTIRETKNTWRLRQRPPDCFGKCCRTKCINKGGEKESVCLVYGTPKKNAGKRRACR